jgi:hypothetical protein
MMTTSSSTIRVYEAFTGAVHVVLNPSDDELQEFEYAGNNDMGRMKRVLAEMTGIEVQNQVLFKGVDDDEQGCGTTCFCLYDRSVVKPVVMQQVLQGLMEKQKEEEAYYVRQGRLGIDQGGDLNGAIREMYDFCQSVYEAARVMRVAIEHGIQGIEPQYMYIHNMFDDFQASFDMQRKRFDDIFTTFDRDVESLKEIKVLSSSSFSSSSNSERKSRSLYLSDVVGVERLVGVAKDCRKANERFSMQVEMIEADFIGLKDDVESLFLRAPPVDVATLYQDMIASKDDLVGDNPYDDAINRMLEHASDFAVNFSRARLALQSDAIVIMRSVSSAQTRIRSMKDAIGPFLTALERQNATLEELEVVRRIKVAYKKCLAECIRRNSFAEKYASFASELAERMGSFREKEIKTRDTFMDHVAGIIPQNILEDMGLDNAPPVCDVSIQEEDVKPLQISIDYLRTIPIDSRATETYERYRPRENHDSVSTSPVYQPSSSLHEDHQAEVKQQQEEMKEEEKEPVTKQSTSQHEQNLVSSTFIQTLKSENQRLEERLSALSLEHHIQSQHAASQIQSLKVLIQDKESAIQQLTEDIQQLRECIQ